MGLRRFLPVAIAGAIVAMLLGITVVSAAELPEECATSGATLQQAKAAYGKTCTQPRVDCDPVGGVWYCSSRVIGTAAPGGVSIDDVGVSDITKDDLPVTVAPPTLPPGTEPPVTQPPSVPTLPPTTVTSTTEPPSTSAPTTDTTVEVTTPAPSGDCGVVAIEAESLAINGSWRVVGGNAASGGSYLTWEGLSREKNNNRPADIISTTITIAKPGAYSFTWAMRQPGDVESDKANDSWVNFPDATRFGPEGGGSYGGFIKVFGNAKGSFGYRATADVNHKKSKIVVVFDQPGDYKMQLAGRSHGHQIDRIVLHHRSVSQADAIAGRDPGCIGVTEPTTTQPTGTQPTTTQPTTTRPTTTQPTTTSPGPCSPNSSGQANLGKDLISLHYDHAPDRDDGHATVAGKEVATKLGFVPWVVGGAYGADNAQTYRPESEKVMNATWGAGGWTNADADWNGAVSSTADRWQQTLQACGDVWIAEGGQSDFSADVVRELKKRMPGLDAERRIHLVQHSDWNEDKALDADLRYVKNNTDYIRIPDGNGGGNGTAGLNKQNYTGPFIDLALNGRNGDGWKAGFDYYNPRTARLDFSDTVELLHILNIGTDEVNNPADFADRFIR